MITASLIGVSGFAGVHYKDLVRQAERGRVQLKAATVINPQEEAEKCAHLQEMGCQVYTDYREMLAAEPVDLCFIPTGIPLHAPMTIAALEARCNVMVEKPAAATIQEVIAMEEAETASGKFVAVGFQTMYAQETARMKQAIVEGEIGAVQSIKCRGLWPRLDSYYARNRWAGRLQLDGKWILDSPFNNAIAHQLNMICFLAGTELNRSADFESIEAELYRAHEIESADTACMRMITTSGIPVFFFVTHASEGIVNPEIVIRGERGAIYWSFKGGWIQKQDGTREEFVCETWDPLRDRMLESIFRRIEDPGAFVCTLQIAGAQTLCVNGAHESSPVHLVPSDLIRRVPQEDSVKTIIDGLDEVMEQAFQEERLFSELGVDWAKKGRMVSLKNYTRFNGPRGLIS